jgi:hypothetical protein
MHLMKRADLQLSRLYIITLSLYSESITVCVFAVARCINAAAAAAAAAVIDYILDAAAATVLLLMCTAVTVELQPQHTTAKTSKLSC